MRRRVTNIRGIFLRKFIVLAAAAAAVTAAPAVAQERAGEGRLELRGGVAWATGVEEAFAGVAAGYDFDLGTNAFVGVEGSADKVLVGGATVLWSVGGRVGVKAGTAGKAFLAGGWGFTKGGDAPYLGLGYQHKFGESMYGKIEYRRTLDNGPDVNFAGVGLGVTF